MRLPSIVSALLLAAIASPQNEALPTPTLKQLPPSSGRMHWFGAVRKLKVPFLTRGTVFMAHDYYDRNSGGFPAKASDRLFYTDGDAVKRIGSLQLLQCLVRSRTPQDALSFVRLRTSPAIFHAYDFPRVEWAEILTYEDVKPSLLFGVDELE